MTAEDSLRSARLEEYKHVTAQFRALTDIRFKLLGLLPLGTVATVALTTGEDGRLSEPGIAAFGFAVTLALGTYNGRNDQHYDELVGRAAHLERQLGLPNGSFNQRPASWFHALGPVRVEHRWPVGLIYAASAALWAYVFVAGLVDDEPVRAWLQGRGLNARWVELGAPGAVLAGWQWLRSQADAQGKALGEAVRALQPSFEALESGHLDLEQVALAIADADALEVRHEKALRRLDYAWGRRDPERENDTGVSESALALAAVIDQPARWIDDLWSGRR